MKEVSLTEIKSGTLHALYQPDAQIDYFKMLTDFISHPPEDLHLLAPSDRPKRFTYLTTQADKKFIIKLDGGVEQRLERRLINVLSGNFFFNLMKRLSNANANGCDITYQMYLVAYDKQSKMNYMIFNYIEGRTLTEQEMTQHREAIKNCIETLHRFGLASNDIHAGNFLMTDSGIKVIDLTPIGFSWTAFVNDAIELRDKYQIIIKVSPLLLNIKDGLHRLRHLSRKLRGKVN